VFLNARTAGSRDMQHCHAISREPNVSSRLALTRPRTTVNLHGVVKQTKRSILLVLRQKKVSSVHTCSSAQIVMRITKLTPICTYSESIDSIMSGISKSTMRFVKTG